MGDITFRAKNILETCDFVLAEDTRVTSGLFQKLGITAKILSYHKFSEKKSLQKHLDEIKSGKNIGIVSDAGTPAISDPGKYLIKEALENKIKVVPIPGPSAVATAFSCSGSMSDSFVFAGFLPSKGAVREQNLEKFLSFGLPVVFYEAPTRIKNLVENLRHKCSRIVILRELTKMYEEIFVYNGEEIKEKGEFTIIAEPFLKNSKKLEVDFELVEVLKKSKTTTKDALNLISRIYPEVGRNEIKKLLISKTDV